ncbi:MAG: hypothetical protein JSS60_08480 [Verrucomicrobia bacterium]|nr:hypothetical protein [Verrucomicrobiota bacterium]
MSEKLMPIITGLIVGPASLPATIAPPTPAPIESTFPATKGTKSASLRKIRFETAYQSNFISIQQIGVPKTQFVGELQERWQFPSDHLPIGMSIDGVNMVSWNVLNSEYMSWVEKNTQGLSRSQIAQEHIYIDGTRLTVRDLHVIEMIKSMLAHPTHPRSVVSLQECSPAFIEELQRQLPEEYGVILSSESAAKDQNIVIYDKRVLDYDPARSRIDSGVFSIQPERTVMNLCFVQKEGAQQTFRVINAHLPGEPGNPAPADLAAYAASVSTPGAVTIAMGDMNFNEVEMSSQFQKNTPAGYAFQFLAPYCTNIGLDLYSKSIDHFLIYSQGQHEIMGNTAEETMLGLNETVHLLEPDFFICNEGP